MTTLIRRKKAIKEKILKIVWIICFSLFLSGCITTGEWEYPEPPKLEKVNFKPVEEGFLITTEDATKLVNNVDELKAHIEKLEVLIKTMRKYNK